MIMASSLVRFLCLGLLASDCHAWDWDGAAKRWTFDKGEKVVLALPHTSLEDFGFNKPQGYIMKNGTLWAKRIIEYYPEFPEELAKRLKDIKRMMKEMNPKTQHLINPDDYYKYLFPREMTDAPIVIGDIVIWNRHFRATVTKMRCCRLGSVEDEKQDNGQRKIEAQIVYHFTKDGARFLHSQWIPLEEWSKTLTFDQTKKYVQNDSFWCTKTHRTGTFFGPTDNGNNRSLIKYENNGYGGDELHPEISIPIDQINITIPTLEHYDDEKIVFQEHDGITGLRVDTFPIPKTGSPLHGSIEGMWLERIQDTYVRHMSAQQIENLINDILTNKKFPVTFTFMQSFLFRVGDRVRHANRGDGTVVHIKAMTVTVTKCANEGKERRCICVRYDGDRDNIIQYFPDTEYKLEPLGVNLQWAEWQSQVDETEHADMGCQQKKTADMGTDPIIEEWSAPSFSESPVQGPSNTTGNGGTDDANANNDVSDTNNGEDTGKVEYKPANNPGRESYSTSSGSSEMARYIKELPDIPNGKDFEPCRSSTYSNTSESSYTDDTRKQIEKLPNVPDQRRRTSFSYSSSTTGSWIQHIPNPPSAGGSGDSEDSISSSSTACIPDPPSRPHPVEN